MEPRGLISSTLSTVSDKFQIIHNIHNQDLNNRESQFICNKISNDLDLCSPNPLHRNLLLAGDLNISSVAGRRFSYASPVPTVEANFSNSDRGTGSRMEKLLNDARLVENRAAFLHATARQLIVGRQSIEFLRTSPNGSFLRQNGLTIFWETPKNALDWAF